MGHESECDSKKEDIDFIDCDSSNSSCPTSDSDD